MLYQPMCVHATGFRWELQTFAFCTRAKCTRVVVFHLSSEAILISLVSKKLLDVMSWAGEAFVMWSVTHCVEEAHVAACVSYADAIASLIPMLLRFTPVFLGWRNKLLVCAASFLIGGVID